MASITHLSQADGADNAVFLIHHLSEREIRSCKLSAAQAANNAADIEAGDDGFFRVYENVAGQPSMIFFFGRAFDPFSLYDPWRNTAIARRFFYVSRNQLTSLGFAEQAIAVHFPPRFPFHPSWKKGMLRHPEVNSPVWKYFGMALASVLRSFLGLPIRSVPFPLRFVMSLTFILRDDISIFFHFGKASG